MIFHFFIWLCLAALTWVYFMRRFYFAQHRFSYQRMPTFFQLLLCALLRTKSKKCAAHEITGLVLTKSMVSQYKNALGIEYDDDNDDDDDDASLYPFIIQAATFPVFFLLMIKKWKLSDLLGAVHLRNRCGFHGAPLHFRIDCRYDIVYAFDPSETTREHTRGEEIDVIMNVYDEDDQLVQSTLITLLLLKKKGVKKQTPQAQQQEGEGENIKTPNDAKCWTMSVENGAGRRFASFCKDYNPIHVHAALARLFGFKKAIAHGMALQARYIHQLLLDKRQQQIKETRHYILLSEHAVEFVRPVFIPSQVTASVDSSDGGGELRNALDNDKVQHKIRFQLIETAAKDDEDDDDNG